MAAVVNHPASDVDVVILSYNRPELTLAAIDSARRQEGVTVRVIVVDQGSAPPQIEALRALQRVDPRVSVIELGENLGVPAGRNRGVAAGQARVVVGLDNDADLPDPHALARVVSAFDADWKLGALAFRVLFADTGVDDPLCWVHGASRLPDAHRRFFTSKFVGCGFGLRRAALREVGGFDERLFFCREELDLSYRLVNAGFVIVYDPQVIVRHHRSSTERVRWAQGRWRHFVRNGVYVGLKHGRVDQTLPLAAGLVVKGAVNGLMSESLVAVAEGLRMY